MVLKTFVTSICNTTQLGCTSKQHNTMNHCLAPTYDCHTELKDHLLKHKIKVVLKESKDNSIFELDWKFTKESKQEKIKSKKSNVCKTLTICNKGG
jgi:hypothetical protein